MSSTALAVIEKEIRSNEVMTRISDSLGKPATDPSVKKFINGAMMYIQSKVGSKGDVSHCTKQSIIDSLINAATVRLPVDNKHYACLVAYKDVCNFQPEWRGYVAKIKEADSSAVVTVGMKFKGDVFTYSRTDNTATYNHVPANAFEDNPANIEGAYCFIKTDTGSYIEVMSRKELDAVRGTSKVAFDFMWKAWPLEMYKKTMIRRACKVKFTEAVSDLDALDNKMFNDRQAKEIPVLAKTAPLPPEQVMEAEIVKDGEEEKKEPAAPAQAASTAAKEEAGTVKDAPGETQQITGGIEKYYAPRGNGPHSWRVDGTYYQIFSKEKDGTDNAPIIKLMGDLESSMKNVKLVFKVGSYEKDGVKIPVNTIVNAYDATSK